MSRFFSLLAILAMVMLTGCASAPFMPLADEAPKFDQTKPLYLMSVVVKNDYKQRWQPRILNVILDKPDASGKPQPVVFRMDGKGVIEADSDDGTTTYLVRFTTDSIPQTVRGFNSMASAFPIHGFYFVPLHANVSQADNGVYYLGAIKGVIRERKDNEFRAGPAIPLIDQAIAGASTGTFEIEISDSFATDIEMFRKAFPMLKDVDVKKAILPKWDRAKAQVFWEQS
jgi:hypothetical protein